MKNRIHAVRGVESRDERLAKKLLECPLPYCFLYGCNSRIEDKILQSYGSTRSKYCTVLSYYVSRCISEHTVYTFVERINY